VLYNPSPSCFDYTLPVSPVQFPPTAPFMFFFSGKFPPAYDFSEVAQLPQLVLPVFNCLDLNFHLHPNKKEFPVPPLQCLPPPASFARSSRVCYSCICCTPISPQPLLPTDSVTEMIADTTIHR
jgi:hypothetical protein